MLPFPIMMSIIHRPYWYLFLFILHPVPLNAEQQIAYLINVFPDIPYASNHLAVLLNSRSHSCFTFQGDFPFSNGNFNFP